MDVPSSKMPVKRPFSEIENDDSARKQIDRESNTSLKTMAFEKPSVNPWNESRPGAPLDFPTFYTPVKETAIAAYNGYRNRKDFRAFCCSYLVLEPLLGIFHESSQGMSHDDSLGFHSIYATFVEYLESSKSNESAETVFEANADLFERYERRIIVHPTDTSQTHVRPIQARHSFTARFFRWRQSLKQDDTATCDKQQRQDDAVRSLRTILPFTGLFPRVDVQKLVLPNLGPYTEDGEHEFQAYARLYSIFYFASRLIKRIIEDPELYSLNEGFFKDKEIPWESGPSWMSSISHRHRRVPNLIVVLKVRRSSSHRQSFSTSYIRSRDKIAEGNPNIRYSDSPSSVTQADIAAETTTSQAALFVPETDDQEDETPANDPSEKASMQKSTEETPQEVTLESVSSASEQMSNNMNESAQEEAALETRVYMCHWQLEDQEIIRILKGLGMWKKIDVKQPARFDPRKLSTLNSLIEAITTQFKLDDMNGGRFKIDLLFARHTDEEGDEVRANLFERDWEGNVKRIIATASPIVFEFWVKPMPKKRKIEVNDDTCNDEA